MSLVETIVLGIFTIAFIPIVFRASALVKGVNRASASLDGLWEKIKASGLDSDESVVNAYNGIITAVIGLPILYGGMIDLPKEPEGSRLDRDHPMIKHSDVFGAHITAIHCVMLLGQFFGKPYSPSTWLPALEAYAILADASTSDGAVDFTMIGDRLSRNARRIERVSEAVSSNRLITAA